MKTTIKMSQLKSCYHLKYLYLPCIEIICAFLYLLFFVLKASGNLGKIDNTTIDQTMLETLLYLLLIHFVLLLFTRKSSHVLYFNNKINVKSLLQDLNSESFVSIEGIPAKLYLESEHWIYLNKKFIAKNSVIGCSQFSTYIKGGSDYFTFHFIDGSHYNLRLSFHSQYTKEIKEQLKKTLPFWKLLRYPSADGITRLNQNSQRILKEYCDSHESSEIYNKSELLHMIITSQKA